MTDENNVYYKVLGEGGKPYHGGTGQWSLPVKLPDGTWQPGEWMPRIKNIKPCKRGYHVCRLSDIRSWAGPELYAVEVGGKGVWTDDKGVFGRARLLYRYETWNDRTARLFACDCAERALHLTAPTEGGEPDARCVGAIAVARRYANGQATKRELAVARDAAWAAAWTSARYAVWYAARAAARAAAWAAARAAARGVARGVARAAAWAPAWYAAMDAARNAAWAAAWDAAWAAARGVARGVAWDAAWDAASDAARDAEQKWQNERLMQYLKGEEEEKERKQPHS